MRFVSTEKSWNALNSLPCKTLGPAKKADLFAVLKDALPDVLTTALSSSQEIKREISKNIEDIDNFLKVYVSRDFSVELEDILNSYGENEICDEDIIHQVILSKKTEDDD